MPIRHPVLLSVLLLGASTVVHSQAVRSAAEVPLSASLFSAPSTTTPAEATRVPGGPSTLSPEQQAALGGTLPRGAKFDTPSAFVLQRPKPPGSSQDGTASDKAAAIDLGPLRYYAAQNDLARVAAEIRLLRSSYAGWEPPEDLFAEVRSGVSEQPLWDLFGKHDIVGVHAAMDDMRARIPGWQPSSDLSGKLALAEAYDTLVKASDTQQWGTVIDIATASPGLLTCGNVDAIWRTAEALAQSNDEQHAADAYRFVIASCPKPEDRLATVQKANGILKSPELIENLIQSGKRVGGHGEFDQVRFDVLRQKIGEAAAGKSIDTPAQSDIDALAANARASGGKTDAQLLGWYAYSHKDYAKAETWFTMALQNGANPKSAEGLVLTLRDGGKLADAQKAAIQYADLDHPNRKLMIEILSANLGAPGATPLNPADLAMLGRAIDTEASADGAQAYGWSLYKADDLAGADAWFHKSAAWQPSESAAIGLMVTAKRLKHNAEYAALVAQYRTVYSRVADLDKLMHGSTNIAMTSTRKQPRLARNNKGTHARVAQSEDGGWDQSATAIVKTFESGQYDQAVAMLEQRKSQGRSEPRGLSVVRGWAMYHKGDWTGAQQVFADLKNGMPRESQEGLRVIQQGYTNPRYR
ncbi:hypothetical protein [Lichenihabitans psoromatis]|uniref:hypothetical protein n=1 Tax=Lichenihabitans psoromatis TaxID=2528642 RepID=UPI00103695F6|nr:hypothetical protein [Lichenihabitans psoromatis]